MMNQRRTRAIFLAFIVALALLATQRARAASFSCGDSQAGPATLTGTISLPSGFDVDQTAVQIFADNSQTRSYIDDVAGSGQQSSPSDPKAALQYLEHFQSLIESKSATAVAALRAMAPALLSISGQSVRWECRGLASGAYDLFASLPPRPPPAPSGGSVPCRKMAEYYYVHRIVVSPKKSNVSIPFGNWTLLSTKIIQKCS